MLLCPYHHRRHHRGIITITGPAHALRALAQDGPLKAAWVYVGPVNDDGWTTAHDEARKGFALSPDDFDRILLADVQAAGATPRFDRVANGAERVVELVREDCQELVIALRAL